MKVIDILNKIANGEAPKLIKYDNLIWKYKKQFGDYTDTEKYLFCDYMADKENIILFLNDEIEIIEEDKKIEKINIPEIDDIKNARIVRIEHKINEIINEINKLKGDKNE